MMLFKQVKIRSYEVGLYFRDGEFQRLLTAGRHWLFDPLWKVRVDVVSQRDPWLEHDKLDVIVKSGALVGLAEVIDLKDHQRALVWIEGRFSHVLPPGLYAYWTGFKDVRVEVIDAREVRLQHSDLKTIVRSPYAAQVLEIYGAIIGSRRPHLSRHQIPIEGREHAEYDRLILPLAEDGDTVR